MTSGTFLSFFSHRNLSAQFFKAWRQHAHTVDIKKIKIKITNFFSPPSAHSFLTPFCWMFPHEKSFWFSLNNEADMKRTIQGILTQTWICLQRPTLPLLFFSPFFSPPPALHHPPPFIIIVFHCTVTRGTDLSQLNDQEGFVVVAAVASFFWDKHKSRFGGIS